MSRGIITLSNDYYGRRENTYLLTEVMERYNLALQDSPEVVVKDTWRMVVAPPLPNSMKELFDEKNIRTDNYTFEGNYPYYVHVKSDRQYMGDQMGFVKQRMRSEWHFKELAPGLVLISNYEKGKGDRGYLTLTKVVYLRGLIKDEKY